jgi:hypothetical protein
VELLNLDRPGVISYLYPVGGRVVGRRAERQRARKLLARAREGFAALAVVGESGIGKSLLLGELGRFFRRPWGTRR